MNKQHDLIAELIESKTLVTVKLKRPTMRYLDEFIGINCAPDLVALKVFPNSKEVTESFAAFRAVAKGLCYDHTVELSDPETLVICVGDGSTPRTAATFAFRSRWTAWSVDPRANWTPKGPVLERIKSFRCRIEDLVEDNSKFKQTIVVAVHSHAVLDVAVKHLQQTGHNVVAAIALPCCVPQTLFGIEPTISYEDWGIWSPKRTVLIWKHLPPTPLSTNDSCYEGPLYITD